MTSQETQRESSVFTRVVEKIRENKILREQGYDITIPFPFPRFSNFVPGIQKGTYYLVTANQKAGKSQITDFMFMLSPVEFVLTHQTNIKVKILYFSLEMSKELKMKQAIVHRMYMKHNIRYTVRRLESLYSTDILPDDMLRLIEEDKPWFEKFESVVEFIDDIRNPFGIYKYLRSYFEQRGHYEYKKVWITEDSGEKKQIDTIDRYIPDDKDLFTIIIIDNVNLLRSEKKATLYETIEKFSSEYMIRVRNLWGGIPVIVQQQALTKESNESIKMDRLEPSADGLADYKATSKDVDIMLTLYSPFRHKIRRYLNYDITRLKDSYRRLAVEFDRNGEPCETSLYFDGAVNYFKELPPAEQMTDEVYQKIEKRIVITK